VDAVTTRNHEPSRGLGAATGTGDESAFATNRSAAAAETTLVAPSPAPVLGFYTTLPPGSSRPSTASPA
jgi:hypothetical protein